METITPYPDPLDASRLIVSVPIPSSPGDSVVMFAEDYERWTAEHGIRTLHVRATESSAYVFFRPYGSTNRNLILARYLMDSPLGRQVLLTDGDPLNLRRTNLECRKGGGGGMTWKRKPNRGGPAGVALSTSTTEPPRPVIVRPPIPLRKPVIAEKVRIRGTV